METKFRNSLASIPAYLLLSSTILLPTLAWSADLCSWVFSPKTLVLDAKRELSEKPHSAYYIGQNVSEANLRQIIEEISGVKPLDSEGCIGGRCQNDDKARIREYLSQKMKFLEVPVYYEYSRSDISESRKRGGDADTIERLFDSGRYETVIRFLQRANFEFSSRGFSKLDIKSIQKLMNDIKSPPSSHVPVFGIIWGHLRDTPFITHPILKGRLLGELKDLAQEIKNAERRSESTTEPPDIVNVIAEIPGTKYPNSILEVSAHYDTVPAAPGADDNGSGVSTMLEMIRIFKKYPPERTIRFVFTDLEERGMKGSRLHVHNLLAKKEKVFPALIIDTIGYHPQRNNGKKPVYVLELGDENSHHQSRLSYTRTKALVQAITWQSNRYQRDIRFSVQFEDALPGTADHGSYIRRGFPAVLAAAGFHSDLINPGYHKSSDTIENYNWPFFLGIARVLTESMAVISGARVSNAEYQALTQKDLSQLGSKVNPKAAKDSLLTKIPNDGVDEYTGRGIFQTIRNAFFKFRWWKQ